MAAAAAEKLMTSGQESMEPSDEGLKWPFRRRIQHAPDADLPGLVA
jgi:hypothetical protein